MNEGMDARRLGEFRNVLLQERAKTESRISEMEEKSLNTTIKESTGELVDYDDNHPGDEGTATFQRSMDLGLLSDMKDHLSNVDHALRRIDEGTYGICEGCGRPIPEERLKAIPSAVLCVDCKLEDEGPPEVGPEPDRRWISDRVMGPDDL